MVVDIDVSTRRQVESCLAAQHGLPRSLVLVVHTGKTGYDYAAEWSNLNYFLRHGVNTSSADYIFILPDPSVETWPPHIARLDNGGSIRLMTTRTKAPCDLCAHGMILQSIGVDNIIQKYGMVVTMNTGVRGEVAVHAHQLLVVRLRLVLHRSFPSGRLGLGTIYAQSYGGHGCCSGHCNVI